MISCTDHQSEDRNGEVATKWSCRCLALGESHCRLSCTHLFASLISLSVMGRVCLSGSVAVSRSRYLNTAIRNAYLHKVNLAVC